MLQNTDRHLNCYCYDAKSTVMELLKLDRNEAGTVCLCAQELVFVLRGSLQISIEKIELYKTLQAHEFVFLPAGSEVSYHTLDDCEILYVRMVCQVPECHIFRIDKLTRPLGEQERGIHSLRTNDRLKHLLAGLRQTLEDGLKCKQYLQLELSRILYLLHAYYSQEECRNLFSSVLTPDMEFSEFVRLNHMNYRTIGDLAAAMHMSRQQFSCRFRKVFGVPPRTWLQQERAQEIYRAICKSDKSFKEIAFDHDFSVHSNFIRFCRNTFGATPGKIRKNLKKSFTPEIVNA